MIATYLGSFLFAVPHLLISIFPAVRDRFEARVGAPRFKGLFAATVGLGFILQVMGYILTRGSGEMLYAPSGMARHLSLTLATLGFILMATNQGKSHLRLWLQNPFSIGVALWAIAHLLMVGKTAVVWFYGTLLIVAVVDILSCMLRGKRPDYQPVWRADAIAVGAGLVLSLLLVTLFHPYVLGVNPLQ